MALGLSLTLASLQGADEATLLNRWFAAQSNLQTWSADLVQTRALKVLVDPLVSTGRVWVATPDRFRWELGQPPQTIAVRQPDKLFVIYPRLKRAEEYPLKEHQAGPWRDALALLEASFPRSRPELESRFRLLSANCTNALCQLVLEPRTASARRFMAEIRVTFRTNDYALVSTEMKFSDDSTLRNEFFNAVTNAPLDERLFEVKLEPDFDLVQPAQP